jgi:hypothetical protein
MRKCSILALGLCLLIGCSTPEPRQLLPDLPTAVPPDPNQVRFGQGGNWALSFSYAFPANFWNAGPHQYTLITDCPIVAGGGETVAQQAFIATEDAPLHDGPIYLRLNGLSIGVVDQIIEPIRTIHPQQETIAVVTFPQLPEEALEPIAQQCSVTFIWDTETNIQTLEPQEPFEMQQ